MFKSLPFSPREVRATEAVLTRIYDAAKMGLKGDSLALAAGLLPLEFRSLCNLDPMAEMAAMKGKADGEMLHAGKLAEASLNGDAKASLAILQNVHGWVAKQQVEVTNTNVSIKALLDERDERIKGIVYEHDGIAESHIAANAEPRVLPVPAEVRAMGVSVGAERPEAVRRPAQMAERRAAGDRTLSADLDQAPGRDRHAA